MKIKRKSGRGAGFSRPLNLRVPPGLLDSIREAAGLAQLPVSAWVRERMSRAARREILAAAGPNLKKESAMKTANPPTPPSPGTRKWIGRVSEEVSVGMAGERIAAVEMLRGRGGAKHDMSAFPKGGTLARRAKKEIGEYLRGERKTFDLPVDLSALTPFSREVLLASERIPYGETRSYAWVAKEAGRPKAARAVGQALHRNPVPLIIP
jgi:O6-methylguanine-DNA--protein-cysteine methyltransferase